MKQPSWIKEMKRQEVIPDQITITGRAQQQSTPLPMGTFSGGGLSSPSPPPQQPSNSLPMSVSPQGSRLTGTGVDNTLQPQKMAGQVHEGEGILSANAMQNFTPQEFESFSRALEGGVIDKNLFLQSIGNSPVKGYATGGIAGEEPLSDTLKLPTDGFIGATDTATKGTTDASTIKPVSTAEPSTATTATKTALPLNTLAGTTPVTKIPGLNASDSTTVMSSARNRASGKAFEPLDIQNTEMLAKAGRNMQTTAANTVQQAGLNGQGAANEVIRNTDQTLLSNLSTNLLDRQVQKQTMMDGGAQDLITIGNSINANKTSATDTTNRIAEIIKSGKGKSAVIGDIQLRTDIANERGVPLNDASVDTELDMLYNANVNANTKEFGKTANEMMQGMIDDGATIDQVLADERIYRNTALNMGYDPDDLSKKAIVNEKINTWFKDASLTPADKTVNDYVDSGLVDEDFMKVDGWKEDLSGAIQDMMNGGDWDFENNAPKDGAGMPWDAPDTYFKYNDWNGNEIGTDNYNPDAAINVEGNGTKYINKATGAAVSMTDANAVWSGLSSSTREKYFDESGEMDTEQFLKDNFRTTTGPDGKSLPVTTKDEYFTMVSDAEYSDKIDTLLTTWNDTSMETEDVDKDSTATGDTASITQYTYYDEYGKADITEKSNNLGFIWQQLSDKFTGGELMNEAQFSQYWNNGKGWFVNKDGVITNIESQGTNTVAVDTATSSIDKLKNTLTVDGKIKNINATTALLPSEARALSAEWDNVDSDLKVSDDFWLEEHDSYKFTTKLEISDETAKYVDKNIGKLYKSKENGRIYQITGRTDRVILVDVETGLVVNFVNHNVGKNQKSIPFSGESYL